VSELDQKFLDKIQELIQLGEQVKQTRYSKSTGNMVVIGDAGVDSGSAHQWGTSCLNLFRRVFGQDSVHYENFQAKFPRFHNYSPVTQALGVLRAAKDDYERGFLFDTRTLIEVEVFDDFPGARRALAWRWLLPARSSGGCILEDSLRKLCTRQEVSLSVKPKLGTMNAGLAKQGVYNKLTQKRITALADIRNKAAHGEWDECTKADVEDMLRGVRQFMETHFA